MGRSSWSLGRVLGDLRSKLNRKKRPGANPQNRRRFSFEPLEDRTLLSVCVWTGGGGTLHTNWNSADNWVSDQQQPVAPVAGDSLRFEGTGTVTQNDFPAGTSFSSITFADGGFALTGNGLCLSNGIVADSSQAGSTISLNIALANATTVEVAANTTLTISGVLSGSNYLAKTGAGTLSLSGVNTYSGGTTIDDGTLKVENDGALVQCGNGVLVNGNNAVFDLNGHSITVGTVGLIDGSIVNSSATAATLTGSTYVVLNGTINVGLGGDAAVLKGTTGVVTLGSNAWDPILDGSGADIQNGAIVFNYAGGASPASTVKNLLTDSYDGGLWDCGQFRNSTAGTAGLSLGWADDTLHEKITVMATSPADANLDGVVDGLDLNVWMANVGRNGVTWSEADFNYDGTVNGLDLDLWRSSLSVSSDSAPPSVLAIARMGSETTSASSVQFAVVFNKAITGVDAGDFALDCTGASGTIASVVDWSPSHAVYLVSVNNVSGDGTLGLNLVDNDTIVDAHNVALVGNGTDDGSFIGDVYTVASPYVWQGGGSDNDWSTAANWAGNVAPQAGADLRFVSTETTTTAYNDFPEGTSFGSIEFASNGFELSGNPLTVTGGISGDVGVSDATISADVALDGSVTVDVADADASLTISSVISGDSSLTKTGVGALTLSGASIYTGDTEISGGTLAIAGGDNRLPVGTAVILGSGTNSGVLQLGDGIVACNQTLAGLTESGTSAYNRVIGGGSGNATLTLNISGADSFGGILGGAGTYDNNLALIKTNMGTLVLTGASTYIGLTTMQAGTLQLGLDAQTPVLTGGGADIQGGRMVFDYTALSPNPATTIHRLLTYSYDGGLWDRGKFASSTAGTTGLTLGWRDDATERLVAVRATWASDFNLDGSVDGMDRSILFVNAGASNATFQMGDTNYDGSVDGMDMAVSFSQFGQALPDAGGFLLGEGSTFVMNLTDDGPTPVDAMGRVTLDDPTLSLTSGRTNNEYGIIRVLIQNDRTEAVVGTFNGLPEGSEVVVGGVTYFITYKGLVD